MSRENSYDAIREDLNKEVSAVKKWKVWRWVFSRKGAAVLAVVMLIGFLGDRV